MTRRFDLEAEVVRLVQSYYDVADTVVAAEASGCKQISSQPFSLPNRLETKLRRSLPVV